MSYNSRIYKSHISRLLMAVLPLVFVLVCDTKALADFEDGRCITFEEGQQMLLERNIAKSPQISNGNTISSGMSWTLFKGVAEIETTYTLAQLEGARWMVTLLVPSRSLVFQFPATAVIFDVPHAVRSAESEADWSHMLSYGFIDQGYNTRVEIQYQYRVERDQRRLFRIQDIVISNGACRLEQ